MWMFKAIAFGHTLLLIKINFQQSRRAAVDMILLMKVEGK